MATDKTKRIPGQAIYASNFEVAKQALLDAREVILGTAADLVNPKTWEDEDGNVWLAKGLKVAVMNSGGTPELYILKDPDKYTEAASWVKVGDTEGLKPLVLELDFSERTSQIIDGVTFDELNVALNSNRAVIVEDINTPGTRYAVMKFTPMREEGVTLNHIELCLHSFDGQEVAECVAMVSEGIAGAASVTFRKYLLTNATIGLGNVTNDAQVKRSEMGVANGVATLGADGKVPVEQLPELDTSLYLPVAELPTQDIKTDKIYLVPATNTEEKNIYDEYAYINGKWEKFGSVQAKADLSGYYTKTEADGKFAAKTVASSSADGLMSKTDKAKVDALPAAADIVTSVVLEVETI